MKTRLVVLTLLGLVTGGSAWAQAPVDSLRQRLEEAERMLQMLQVQMAEDVGTGVKTRTGYSADLYGLVLMNGFYNSAKVDNSDIPSYVKVPDATENLPARSLGGTIRQTRVGILVEGPGVFGSDFSGELDMSFFGGHLDDGRLAPLFRIRRTRLDLTWSNAWIMVGQEAPPIAEVNPSSLAALDVPNFSYAGNLWFWIPQVRAGFQSSGSVRLGAEGAVLAPMAEPNQPNDAHKTQPNLGERSGRPYLQGRALFGWGDPDLSGGEISLGGHYGWIATDQTTLKETKAVVASLRALFNEIIEVRGEVFTGQALHTLGGGGIGRNFGLNGVPLKTKGGWGQLNLLPTLTTEIGAGFGFDDPDDGQIDPASDASKNSAFEVHFAWRPSPVLFGIEYRRTTTHGSTGGYGSGLKWSNNHINLGFGFEF